MTKPINESLLRDSSKKQMKKLYKQMKGGDIGEVSSKRENDLNNVIFINNRLVVVERQIHIKPCVVETKKTD